MDQPLFLESRKEEMVSTVNAILSSRFERMEDVLAEERTVDNKIEATKVLYDLVDQVFDLVKAYLVDGLEIRCQNGCSYCCDIRVESLPIESIHIAQFIQRMGEDKVQEWVQKLEEHSKYAKDRREKGYQKTCPFLSEDGACQIHEVRPYKCRIYHSLDEKPCKLKRQNYKVGMVDQLDSIIVQNVMEIFRRDRLSLMPAELGQSVLVALKDPACADAWMGGKNPFPMIPEYRERMGGN